MLPMNSVCFRTLRNIIADIAAYATDHLGMATPKGEESTGYHYAACYRTIAHERKEQRTVIFLEAYRTFKSV